VKRLDYGTRQVFSNQIDDNGEPVLQFLADFLSAFLPAFLSAGFIPSIQADPRAP
jgi:hypothetical protein